LQIIKRLNDFEKAVVRFEDLCRRFEKKYPAYIKSPGVFHCIAFFE